MMKKLEIPRSLKVVLIDFCETSRIHNRKLAPKVYIPWLHLQEKLQFRTKI